MHLLVVGLCKDLFQVSGMICINPFAPLLLTAAVENSGILFDHGENDRHRNVSLVENGFGDIGGPRATVRVLFSPANISCFAFKVKYSDRKTSATGLSKRHAQVCNERGYTKTPQKG